MPHPNHQRILDELRNNPEPLIQWAAANLIALGAKLEWSMDDNFNTTEGLVTVTANNYNLPSAGDQSDDDLRFYSEAAQALGFRYDAELDKSPEEDA